MDPNANIAEQTEVAATIMRLWDTYPDNGDKAHAIDEQIAYEGMRLAELVLALNDWIVKGGFLPDIWKRKE